MALTEPGLPQKPSPSGSWLWQSSRGSTAVPEHNLHPLPKPNDPWLVEPRRRWRPFCEKESRRSRPVPKHERGLLKTAPKNFLPVPLIHRWIDRQSITIPRQNQSAALSRRVTEDPCAGFRFGRPPRQSPRAGPLRLDGSNPKQGSR